MVYSVEMACACANAVRGAHLVKVPQRDERSRGSGRIASENRGGGGAK